MATMAQASRVASSARRRDPARGPHPHAGSARTARLHLGPVDDALEREAHVISAQVLRGQPIASPSASAPRGVQRACAACDDAQPRACPACEDEAPAATVRRAPSGGSAGPAVDVATAAAIERFPGRGAPLDAGLQSFFGPRLGFDFSRVRIHDDATAATSARALGARAFTVGSHVGFAAGQFTPHTPQGRALLAHELVHVVQQRAASVAPATIQRAPDDPPPVPAEKTSETLETAYRRRGDTTRADAIRRCRTERACGTLITNAQLRALYSLARSSGGDEAKIKLGLAGPAFVGLGFVSAGGAAGTAAAGGAAAATTGAATTGAAAGGGAAGGGAAVGAGVVAAGVAIIAVVAVLAAIGLYAEYQVSKFRTELEDLGYTVLDEPLGVCIGGCHTSPAPSTTDFGRPLFERFPRSPTLGSEDALRKWLEESSPAPQTGPDADKARPDTEKRKRTCATEFPGLRRCDSLPDGYVYSGITAALAALRAHTGDKNLRLEKTETTTSGPCPGQGTHTKVRSGGGYVATIVCCPCCKDTPAGPVRVTLCRIV